MTEEYVAPDPEIAEFVYQQRRECEQQTERIAGMTADQAVVIALNPVEPTAARLEAMLILFGQRDPRVIDVKLAWLDDPDQELWPAIAHTYDVRQPQIRAALELRLQDADVEVAVHAAIAFARKKEDCVIPVALEWLNSDDDETRHGAIEVLNQLKTPASAEQLHRLWDADWGDADDRLTLAGALATRGHQDSFELLERTAEAGRGAWSGACATQIYFLQPERGLRLILRLLDTGDLEVKQWLVGQMSSLAGHLPHEFTADGIHEVRLWIGQKLEAIARGESAFA